MSNTPQVVEIMAANGDTYTATKTNRDAAWEISYDLGDSRFYGTAPEVKRHIAGLIKVHGADKADGVSELP